MSENVYVGMAMTASDLNVIVKRLQLQIQRGYAKERVSELIEEMDR